MQKQSNKWLFLGKALTLHWKSNRVKDIHFSSLLVFPLIQSSNLCSFMRSTYLLLKCILLSFAVISIIEFGSNVWVNLKFKPTLQSRGTVASGWVPSWLSIINQAHVQDQFQSVLRIKLCLFDTIEGKNDNKYENIKSISKVSAKGNWIQMIYSQRNTL